MRVLYAIKKVFVTLCATTIFISGVFAEISKNSKKTLIKTMAYRA